MLKTESSTENSDEESDDHKPSVIIQRNLNEIIIDPEALATLLRELISSRHEVKTVHYFN